MSSSRSKKNLPKRKFHPRFLSHISVLNIKVLFSCMSCGYTDVTPIRNQNEAWIFFFSVFYCSFLQYAWHYLRITGGTDWHQCIGFYFRKQQSRSTSSVILEDTKSTSANTNHSPSATSHAHPCSSCFHPHWLLAYTRQHHYSAEIVLEVYIRNTWLKHVSAHSINSWKEALRIFISSEIPVLFIVSLWKCFENTLKQKSGWLVM